MFFFFAESFGDGGSNVVPGHKDDTAKGPALNEDDPEGGAEPRPVVVHHPYPDGLLGGPATEEDQEGGHDVLVMKKNQLLFM